MTLNSLSASLSLPEDQRCIDGWVAAANAMGVPVEEFFLSFLKSQGRDYANRYKVGVMPSSEFLLRFTSAEISAIIAAAETDSHIAALLAELRRESSVALDDPRVAPGLQYIMALGFINQERLQEITTYSRPIPRDFEAERAAAVASTPPRRGRPRFEEPDAAI